MGKATECIIWRLLQEPPRHFNVKPKTPLSGTFSDFVLAGLMGFGCAGFFHGVLLRALRHDTGDA